MPQSDVFDEVWGDAGDRTGRPEFAHLAQWLNETSPAEFDRRRQAAEAAFRQLGITFAVYGEEASGERIIPFDIVPRIFTAPEWEQLSAGLVQRVEAINAFLDDLYGPQRILAEGVIPAELVLANAQFQPLLAGTRPPHGIYAHICGIDLVRTGPTDFFVLEDNARTPSGVSYMLENREAMLRLCPELFDRYAVRPIDNYPDLLRETLHSVAPHGAADPVAVLLTPGHYNSAFYEHSFLADQMGIELVEGSDLEVDDDVVWMRTIDGRVRSTSSTGGSTTPSRSPDVRSRLHAGRARPDGRLPGRQRRSGERARHRHRRRQGDLQLHARNRALLFGRGAQAPECRDVALPRAEALRYTLDNLDALVVKLVDGSGGYGMLVGPTASAPRSRRSAPP
jgi:uncharacterized circularly permuted ATP-grasp superfamily protein